MQVQPFPWILERYIFREMGKTFLLASIALTGLVGLGGGVLNMVRLGEVTPGQLGRLMALLLPLAAGLTLPIAVMFAAAATYGRLSADNEFVACRSSGISMHMLCLPSVMLGLVTAALCFGLTNYVIPGMVENLNAIAGADVVSVMRQRLSRPRGLSLGDIRVHADQCTSDPRRPDEIYLKGVAFVEIAGGDWVRFGTAKQVNVQLRRDESHIQLAGQMTGLSYFDQRLGQFVEEAQQAIPVNELPAPLPRKEKFLNLNELLHYASNPEAWYEVANELQKLRVAFARARVCESVWSDWRDDHVVTLSDDDLRLEWRAEQAAWIPSGAGIEFGEVRLEERRPGRRRSITAPRAILEVTRGESVSQCAVRIEVRDAQLSDGTAVIRRQREVLPSLRIPRQIAAQIAGLNTERLLTADVERHPDELLARQRDRVKETRAATLRRIQATLCERAAFCSSVIVLVILATVLAIVLRGAHVMTAFGISFVPMLFVILTIVTGRQMAQNADTHVVGLMLLWSGLLVVTGSDVWALTRLLRR